jgi:predicted deacylase
MPPAASTRNLRRLVVGFWMVNLITVVLVAAAWFALRSHAKATFPSPSATTMALPSRTATLSFSPTVTDQPTKKPTRTKTPRPTRTPTQTITPIPLSEGPIKIGESVEERSMEVYRFGSGPIERMIVAGMHGGNEYNTVQLADELIAYLSKHPGAIPEDVTLYILHDLNPDGVARSLGVLGRTNANGVDLNRNWPDGWKYDWNRSGCWTTTYVTGGSEPASEPETRALMAFIKSHHFSALINYHSAALGIFAGGVPPTQASKRLAQALSQVSTYQYPPVDTGCEYTGGMVDWTADQGIASVDIELSNHTDTDFEMNLKILDIFLNWEP